MTPPVSEAVANKAVDMEKPMPLVRSGHSWRQKVQFASCIISPSVCGAVLFFGKDIYILEMGADVKVMSVVGTLLAIWGPCCNPIAGYVLEKNALRRCFPWESWGRRAPWVLVHCCLGALSSAAMYVPPTMDPMMLCFWYLLCGTVICWVLAILFACFEAGRAELYPTKEERSEVEALVKVGSGIGNAFGAVPSLIVAAGVTSQARSLSGLFLLVAGLASLMSVRVYRMAKQKYDPLKVGGMVQEYASLMRIPVCRHFMAYRFVESLTIVLMLSGCLYHFTLIDDLRGAERSYYAGILSALIALSALVMLPGWTQFFRVHRPNVNVNIICSQATFLGVFSPLWLLAAGLPNPWGFLMYCVWAQLSFTGQTFWRAAVLGWIVDEDCLAEDGRRREAIFVGAFSLASAAGRAIATGIVIVGLALAGLELENCAHTCRLVEATVRETCIAKCEVGNENQPHAVADYVNFLYWFVAPALQLLTAALCYTFPIHGERLEAIYRGQAARFLPTAEEPNAVDDGNRPSEKQHEVDQETVESI